MRPPRRTGMCVICAALCVIHAVRAAARGDDAPDLSGVSSGITVHAAKGDITDVLRLVAQQGGLNLVIGPEVRGEVSVYLENVDVETALRSIAVKNGFEYSLDDNVITVSESPTSRDKGPQTPPLETRVFELRSQDAERVREALEFALSKFGRMKVLNENSQARYGVQMLTSLSGDFEENANSYNASAAQNGRGAGQANGPFAHDASTAIPPKNARKLVVTDVKENVEQIAELIADLDTLPPQVLIEARIVEMTTDLQRRLGIDWNINALANGPILNFTWPLTNRAGFASGSQIMRNPNGTPQVAAGMALGAIDFSQLTALLQANQTDNAIRLLANPRLLVYNNHSASILVGERYPILQATITDFGTVTEAFSTYIPIGVQLEVTPTIMMDGTLSMLVHPATSALGDDVIGTTGLRVARIRTRELDTRVIMQDGQTIVLGGLISDRKTHTVSKVPGLGDVPGLDLLFRQESPRSERVDLLVFLTAHVASALEFDDRDRAIYDMYKPHFKHIERVQDVPLHFEIPSEQHTPRPMFSDPPISAVDGEDDATQRGEEPPGIQRPRNQQAPTKPDIKSAEAVDASMDAALQEPIATAVPTSDAPPVEQAVGPDAVTIRANANEDLTLPTARDEAWIEAARRRLRRILEQAGDHGAASRHQSSARRRPAEVTINAGGSLDDER